VTPPVTPKAAAGRSWRIYLAPSVGYDFGLIPRYTVTELGAYTANLGWGRNAPVFITEAGLLFSEKHRFSAGVRLSTIEIERRSEGSVLLENKSQPQFFARYIRFASADSALRPYFGGGGFGGPLRVTVTHESSSFGGNDHLDSYELGGAFLNAIAGVQLCLGPTCHVAIQAEANLLWRFASPADDPILSTDYLKTFVAWFSVGLAFQF